MKPENSAAAAQRTVTPRTGDAPRWLPAMTVATGMACALIGGQGNAWAAPDEGATSSVSRPSTGDTARDRSRGPRAAAAPALLYYTQATPPGRLGVRAGEGEADGDGLA